MIEALMTIMSSSGVGAITGGLFGWLNRREDRKTRDADQRHELAKIEAGAQAAVSVAEAGAFKESQKTVGAFASAIKSAVRPIITGALLYMTYRILMQLEELTGGITTLTGAEAAMLYRDIVLNIISLTATAVSWWFASRPATLSRG